MSSMMFFRQSRVPNVCALQCACMQPHIRPLPLRMTRHGTVHYRASEPSPDRDGRLSSIINSLNRIAVFEDTHTHTKTLKRARRSGGLKIGRCSNSLDAFFLFSFSTVFHKVHTCVVSTAEEKKYHRPVEKGWRTWWWLVGEAERGFSFPIDPQVGTEKHIRRVDGDGKFSREEIRGGADVALLSLAYGDRTISCDNCRDESWLEIQSEA